MSLDSLGFEDLPEYVRDHQTYAGIMIRSANNFEALLENSGGLTNSDIQLALQCITLSEHSKKIANSINSLSQSNLSISKSIANSFSKLANCLENNRLYDEYYRLQHEILTLEDKLLEIGMLKQAYSEFNFNKIPEITLKTTDVEFISYILDKKYAMQFSKDLFSLQDPWKILQKYLCSSRIRILDKEFDFPSLGQKRFKSDGILKMKELKNPSVLSLDLNGHYIYPLKNSYGDTLYSLKEVNDNYVRFQNDFSYFEERVAIYASLDSISATELLRIMQANFSQDMLTATDLTSSIPIQDSVNTANLIIDIINLRSQHKLLVDALRKYRLEK